MKRLWMVGLLGFFLLPVTAQETVPSGFEHWTAASLKQMQGELNAEAAKE